MTYLGPDFWLVFSYILSMVSGYHLAYSPYIYPLPPQDWLLPHFASITYAPSSSYSGLNPNKTLARVYLPWYEDSAKYPVALVGFWGWQIQFAIFNKVLVCIRS